MTIEITREDVHPMVQRTAQKLLDQSEQNQRAADAAPEQKDESWYLWTKHDRGHVAEIISGFGQGVQATAPLSHRTPESELRMALVRYVDHMKLAKSWGAALERCSKVELRCAEERHA